MKKIITNIFIMFIFCVYFYSTIFGYTKNNNENIFVTIEQTKYPYLIFVGDSRTKGIDNITNNHIFIAKVGEGYQYLKNDAWEEVKQVAKEKEEKGYQPIIILGFGVNDLYNIENYIDFYKDIQKNNPTWNFLFLDVGLVEENTKHYIKNVDIKEFNKRLKEEFEKDYISLSSCFNKKQNNTKDGIHYYNEIYEKQLCYIEEYVYLNELGTDYDCFVK